MDSALWRGSGSINLMDNSFLEDLISQVAAEGGGVMLKRDGKAEAVVLNIDKYNELLQKVALNPSMELVSKTPSSPPTILVTGGAGYIGAHVVRALQKKGYTVIVLDNLSTGKREFVSSGTTFIAGDIADKNLVKDIFEQYSVDAVIHLAAFVEVEESVLNPEKYLHNNFYNTAQLLEVMAESGVKNIIFSSTGSVYGDQTQMPIRETAVTNPTNPYTYSKLLVEKLLDFYSRYQSFSVTILRYFNACGSDFDGVIADPHYSHLVPIIMEVVRGVRDHIVVYGTDYETFDGTTVRDYIHVLDIAAAHVLAMEKIGDQPYAVYNVGTGRGYSVQEMICTAAEVTSKMIPIETAPRRPGDAPIYIADNTKIKQALGFTPTYSDLATIFKTSLNAMQLHAESVLNKK